MKAKLISFSSFILLVLLNFYLFFYIFLDANSIFAAITLKDQIILKKQNVDQINKDILSIKNKINLLSCESNLDLDFAEEIAKQKLGIIKKKEKVIYLTTKDSVTLDK